MGKIGHFDEILDLSEPAYTENTSKWDRFEFGLLASEDAELTMPHHFEEASVYAGRPIGGERKSKDRTMDIFTNYLKF